MKFLKFKSNIFILVFQFVSSNISVYIWCAIPQVVLIARTLWTGHYICRIAYRYSNARTNCRNDGLLSKDLMVGIRYLTIITGFQCFNYVHTCIWYNIRTYALTLLVIIYDRCHVINTRRYHPFSLSYLCYTWTLLVIISRPVPCMNWEKLTSGLILVYLIRYMDFPGD